MKNAAKNVANFFAKNLEKVTKLKEFTWKIISKSLKKFPGILVFPCYSALKKCGDPVLVGHRCSNVAAN